MTPVAAFFPLSIPAAEAGQKGQCMATVKTTTKTKYGINITYEKGPEGWIVGKDDDVLLFADKATATATLKKMKADDRYSWNCEAAVAEFTGWGK